MTTVAELIEYLQTLPQDSKVRCVEEVDDNYPRGVHLSWVDLDIKEHCDFLKGSKILDIGLF
jgi:hypothetical protein